MTKNEIKIIKMLIDRIETLEADVKTISDIIKELIEKK